MFGKKVETDNALQAKVNSLGFELKRKNEEIERLHDVLKQERRDRDAKQKDADVEKRNIQRKNEETLGNLQLDVSNLEDHVETLEGILSDQHDLDERTINLDHREKMLGAREVNADNFVQEIAKTKEQADKDGEQRYKAGYADGLADGLRKAHEITAEDRRAGMQIAALAAASHQPDATKQIAAAIAKDVAKALPSGTSNRKK